MALVRRFLQRSGPENLRNRRTYEFRVATLIEKNMRRERREQRTRHLVKASLKLRWRFTSTNSTRKSRILRGIECKFALLFTTLLAAGKGS